MLFRSGVTVTLSRGKSKAEFGPQVLLVDLPGVHSTSASSPEEELSCRVIEGRHRSVQPDALIVAVDATQLERHLRFASFVARQHMTKNVLFWTRLGRRCQRTFGLDADACKAIADALKADHGRRVIGSAAHADREGDP